MKEANVFGTKEEPIVYGPHENQWGHDAEYLMQYSGEYTKAASVRLSVEEYIEIELLKLVNTNDFVKPSVADILRTLVKMKIKEIEKEKPELVTQLRSLLQKEFKK